MNRDTLAWCLVAVAAIDVAGVMVPVHRNRAPSARKRQAEEALKQQQNEVERQLSSPQAEFHRYTQEPDGTIREAEEATEESAKAVLKKLGARQVPVAGVSDSQGPRPPSRTPEDAGRASGRSLGALQRGTLSGRTRGSASIEGSEEA
ncbi:hypothetical protein [Streptomyces sp. NPDC054783]